MDESIAAGGITPLTLSPREIGGHVFDFSRQSALMAIVNRTPDSFYDRGATFELQAAVKKARDAVEQGAQWVDIGGVPFSPDTPDVSVAEEIERVVPVVAAIRADSDVVISVDTYRVEVARAAIDAGASVINDVTGLATAGMAELIAETGVSVVIAHSKAQPHRHLRQPQYGDVVREVKDFLAQRVELAYSHGVRPEQIVIDPGHDLNKNTLHTLEITRRLSELNSLGLPMLVALSNKDFIGETLDRPRGERVNGSVAAAVWCYTQGARIFRVHEVAPTRDALHMIEAIAGAREPAYLKHNV